MEDIKYYRTIYAALETDVSSKKRSKLLEKLLGYIRELGGELIGTQHHYGKMRDEVYNVQKHLGVTIDRNKTVGKILSELRILENGKLKGKIKHGPTMIAWFYMYHPTEAEKWHKSIQQILPNNCKEFLRSRLKTSADSKNDFDVYNETAQQKSIPNLNAEKVRSLFSDLGLYLPSRFRSKNRTPNDMAFFQQNTDFVGREEEAKKLCDFISEVHPGRKFLWWQLSGAAGQGKSRLALEITKRYEATFEVGFLPPLSLFIEKDISFWSFKKPHLLILDLAINPAHGKQIEALILKLRQSAARDNQPVRLLIIDRQPLSSERRKTQSLEPSELESSWHLILKQSFLGVNCFEDCFNEKPLKLRNLKAEQLFEIGKSWITFRNTLDPKDKFEYDRAIQNLKFLTLEESSPDQTFRQYIRLSHQAFQMAGTPQFAIILADAIFEGNTRFSNIGKRELEAILNDYLDHDTQTLFARQSEPREGLMLSSATIKQHLAAIFINIVGTVNVDHLLKSLNFLRLDKYKDLESVQKILGFDIEVNFERYGALIYCREPSVLREYQVKRSINFILSHTTEELNESLLQVLEYAWINFPNETQSFFIDFVQNYPGEEIIYLCLNCKFIDSYPPEWLYVVSRAIRYAPEKQAIELFLMFMMATKLLDEEEKLRAREDASLSLFLNLLEQPIPNYASKKIEIFSLRSDEPMIISGVEIFDPNSVILRPVTIHGGLAGKVTTLEGSKDLFFEYYKKYDHIELLYASGMIRRGVERHVR